MGVPSTDPVIDPASLPADTLPSHRSPASPAIAYLRSTQAIRDRCSVLFDLACQDRLTYFRCDLEQLDRVADYVLQTMQENYPDGHVPFHSRWRHFEAGSVDRLAQLDVALADFSALEQARIKVDLAVTSVLLDAGAGADWQYVEPTTGRVFCRSEGLAVASLHLFLQGGFSSQPAQPFQADANGLQSFTDLDLQTAFQVSVTNPLVGVTGRVQLMQRLGQVLTQSPQLFGADQPRPGHLVDYLMLQASNGQLKAHTVFEAVLAGFSEIWPGRLMLESVNLGDVWPHSALPAGAIGAQWVPFHKLSQWLTYSLLEPLQSLGLEIVDLDELTGLPEYRNGGLCVDLGLLQPKVETVLDQAHAVGSEVIVEWRALTVILLDQIAHRLRQQLGLSVQDLPLAKVLQGGTWAAGRQIAADRRPQGRPPIQIISDGTVF
jgi:hypothetical protein